MEAYSFKKARIVLTAWYVVILAIILFIFSTAIFTEQQKDFARIIVNRDFGGHVPRVLTDGDRDEVLGQFTALRTSFLLNLLFADGVILVIGGGLSFFLAGKTLEPIQLTFERQKAFLADVSHEIRTPLAAIQTASEVALRAKDKGKEEYKEVIAQVFDESKRLTKMANDLLLLSRIESYSTKTFTTKVNLSEIASSVVQEFTPLARKQKITLVAHIAKNIFVMGSADELTQLLIILMDNAVKYTKSHGSITLAVDATLQPKIVLTDTGIGVPKDEQGKIFERFYQVDSSRSTEGSGLGLAIAKKIIDLHNAEISIKSTLGKGSTFTITFPQV